MQLHPHSPAGNTAVPQCVKRRDPRTKQRRSLRRIERLRHARHSLCRNHHLLRITTVVSAPRDFPRHTTARIAATPRDASAILPAMPFHSHAPPFCQSVTPAPTPSILPATSCPGVRGTSIPAKTVFHIVIAETNPARRHTNPHLPRPRLGNLPLLNLKHYCPASATAAFIFGIARLPASPRPAYMSETPGFGCTRALES